MEEIKTKAIELWLVNDENKKVTISIPFSSIHVLELEGVTTTIGHTREGKYLEFLICHFLNLKIYKKKVSKMDLEKIENYDIISIKLEFDNGTSKSYNTTRNIKKNRNELQSVSETEDLVKIMVGYED